MQINNFMKLNEILRYDHLKKHLKKKLRRI